MAKIAADSIALFVPVPCELDLASIVTRHAKEDEGVAGRAILYSAPFADAQQLKECNSGFGIGDADLNSSL